MRIYEDLLDDLDARKSSAVAKVNTDVEKRPDEYDYVFCFSCKTDGRPVQNPEKFIQRLQDLLDANRFIESFSDIMFVDGTTNTEDEICGFDFLVDCHMMIVGIDFRTFRSCDHVWKFLSIPFTLFRMFTGFEVRLHNPDGDKMVFRDYSDIISIKMEKPSRSAKNYPFAIWTFITFCETLMKCESMYEAKAKVYEYLQYQERWQKSSFVENDLFTESLDIIDFQYTKKLDHTVDTCDLYPHISSDYLDDSDDDVYLVVAAQEHYEKLATGGQKYNLRRPDTIPGRHKYIYNRIMNRKSHFTRYTYYFLPL